MYIIVFMLLCIVAAMLLLCNINKSASAAEPVLNTETYIGPNTDGYKYYGADPILHHVMPLAHRYDVDERASLKFWDEYARYHGDYTYSRLPQFVNDDFLNDPYIILN